MKAWICKLKSLDMEEEYAMIICWNSFQSTMGVDEIVQKIESELFQPGEVLVLTGVGEAFPFCEFIRYWRIIVCRRGQCLCFTRNI